MDHRDYDPDAQRGSRDPLGGGRWGLVSQDPPPPPPPPPGPPPTNEDGSQAPLTGSALDAHHARYAHWVETRRAVAEYEAEHEGETAEREADAEAYREAERLLREADRWVRRQLPPEIRRHLPELPLPPPLPDPGPDGGTAAEVVLARHLLSRIRSPALGWRPYARTPMDYARPASDSGQAGATPRLRRIPLADEPQRSGIQPVAQNPWAGGDPPPEPK
jgi:hypothetical protein